MDLSNFFYVFIALENVVCDLAILGKLYFLSYLHILYLSFFLEGCQWWM